MLLEHKVGGLSVELIWLLLPRPKHPPPSILSPNLTYPELNQWGKTVSYVSVSAVEPWQYFNYKHNSIDHPQMSNLNQAVMEQDTTPVRRSHSLSCPLATPQITTEHR